MTTYISSSASILTSTSSGKSNSVSPPKQKTKNSFPRKRFSKTDMELSEKKSRSSIKSLSPDRQQIRPEKNTLIQRLKETIVPESEIGYVKISKQEAEEIEDMTLEDYYESDFER